MSLPPDLYSVIAPGGLNDQALGVAPPILDTTQDQPLPELTPLQRILQSFAGAENAPTIEHPRNFGEGLVAGLGQGLGQGGTRAISSRQRLQAIIDERAKIRNENNAKATLEYQKERATAAHDERLAGTKTRPVDQPLIDRNPGMKSMLGQPIDSGEYTRLMAQPTGQEKVAQVSAEETARLKAQQAGAGPEQTVSPDAMRTFAEKWWTDGTAPPLGMGNSPAGAANRKLFIETVAQVGKELGYSGGSDAAVNKALRDAYSAGLTQQVKTYGSVSSFQRTAHANLVPLRASLQKLPDTGTRFGNGVVREVYKQLGDVGLQQWVTSASVVIPEFTRILNNPGLSGQVVTDTARKEIGDILDKNHITIPQILASLDVLETDADNRVKSLADQIDFSKQQLQSIGAPRPTKRFNHGTGKLEPVGP